MNEIRKIHSFCFGAGGKVRRDKSEGRGIHARYARFLHKTKSSQKLSKPIERS